MKKRYDSIDIARLFATLGIVYFHMMWALVQNGIRQADATYKLYANHNINLATVCVGIFFMISGFGLMQSASGSDVMDIKAYYFKRFKRVLMPYYLVTFIYFLVVKIVFGMKISQIFPTNPPLPSIIFTALGIDGYLSGFGIKTFSLGIGEWFLGPLIMMYVLFPLLRKLLLKNKWVSLLGATVYFLVILTVYDKLPMAAHMAGYTDFLCKIYDFFVGMFLFTVIDRMPKKITLPVSLIGALSLILSPHRLEINPTGLIFIQNIVIFVFILSLDIILEKVPKFMKVVRTLGTYTYECFLVHHVIINPMTMSKTGIVPFSNKDVLILLMSELLIIAIASFAVHKLMQFILSKIK